MLMLEHKRVPYRRVDVLTLTHAVRSRLHGFDAGGQKRNAGGKRSLLLRLGDLLGTVPALAADGPRVSTNHGIARFLDEHHPEPPLFPADPEQRRAVEEAESWANDPFQMTARRTAAAGAVVDAPRFARETADGRLGYLLYRGERTRRLIFPFISRVIFSVDRAAERELVAELPPMLDRIDHWIEAGVIGGPQPNAADCMIAPSLALMLYRPEIRPLLAGRPALELVDRLLPEPA